jgi:hypothetical protein
MGVIIGMFNQFARLGVTRAAAFFYAVAVGVVANVVIQHFTPHDGDHAPAAQVQASDTPVATAVIAPKPAEQPAQAIPVSVPATAPLSTVPSVALPANSVTASPAPAPTKPPATDTSAAASLPNPAAMAAPVLQPTAMPSASATPQTAAQPATDKPAANVEAAANPTPAAPISLLPPPDKPADQPAPPPKPGPGSGGLY